MLAGWVSSVWIAQDLPDFRLERFYNNYGDISFLAVIHMIVTGGLATESQIFFEDETKLQPEGEDSPTCKVTEVSVCVTWPV